MVKGKKGKKWVGAHVSISGGVENAVIEAQSIGAEAFAMFPKNQRQWSAAPYTKNNIDNFTRLSKEHGFRSEAVLPHSSYLINLGNGDPAAQAKAQNAFVDEIERCEQLGLHLLNIHPGAHLKKISEEACLDLIAENINRAHASTATATATKKVVVVLESTAGQGSCMGHKMVHLKRIIEGVEDKERIGVCLDTCHLYAAGYNIRERSGFEDMMGEFEDLIGIKYLKGMHLNDSKVTLGKRVDRHQSLGKGELGLPLFQWIMNDPRFDEMPLILETIDSTLWPDEIKLLYSFI